MTRSEATLEALHMAFEHWMLQSKIELAVGNFAQSQDSLNIAHRYLNQFIEKAKEL